MSSSPRAASKAVAASDGLMIAARAAQGVGAAIASPAALSLVMTVFPEGKSRHYALAAYAGVARGGAALGVITGRLLIGAAPRVG
jgi:MFS family permease